MFKGEIMKTILFAMIFLTISSSTFAGDTAGNGASMSKNCVGTKAGSQAGGYVGTAAGGYVAALLLGGCAITIVGSVFTLGAGTPVAVPTCTAAGAAIAGTTVVGGAIVGGVVGGKAGEQVGKLADGAGCE
jgi:hypothetical protein